MTVNNSKNLSFWQIFIKTIKQRFKPIEKTLTKFSLEYPNTSQNIQLSFVYFFALIDLFYAVLNNVFSMGSLPEILDPFFPFIKFVLQSPIFKIWASPEKVFFLSYVVIEFMVVRSSFNFSKLVKYNILLIFALLMIQGLVMSYWDLLFHREISTSFTKWTLEQGGVIYSDKNLAIIFFLNTFLIFFSTYFYLYVRALQGKFATLPAMEWLSDSVAFWLRIKTPTMRFGDEKEEKNK